MHSVKVQFLLGSDSGVEKKLQISVLVGLKATKWAVFAYQAGGRFTTKWAVVSY